MTQDHPITPPPELVQQWAKQMLSLDGQGGEIAVDLDWFATQAARWGANQELEACCEYIGDEGKWFANPEHRLAELRAARRPKSPSLKQQALIILDDVEERLDSAKYNILRRALETLSDD
jgi:hypothetical protein